MHVTDKVVRLESEAKAARQVPHEWSDMAILLPKEWTELRDWVIENEENLQLISMEEAVEFARIPGGQVKRFHDLCEEFGKMAEGKVRDAVKAKICRAKCRSLAEKGMTPCWLPKSRIDQNSISEACKLAKIEPPQVESE